MKTWFAVTRVRGRGWDASKPLRAQKLWNEHAVFMDQLAADGTIVLGGPLGATDETFLLIFSAANASEIIAILARDPWTEPGIIDTRDIQRWTILLESGKG